MEELRKFQEYLSEFTITAFTDRRGKVVMFEGPVSTVDKLRKQLDLMYGDNHFNVIVSLEGAFHTQKYCRPCRVPYEHEGEHRCPQKCNKCFHGPIWVEGAAVECNMCKRTFKTQQCFDNHKNAIYTKNRSVCDILKYCTGCKCIYS